MKKINKINIDAKNIRSHAKNTNWHRGVYFALTISIVVFGSLCIYLFYKPISNNIKAIIDEEISSSDIKFDEKTLEMVKERQDPKGVSEPSSGKNPFAPF